MTNKYTLKDLKKGSTIYTKYYNFCNRDFLDISSNILYSYFIPTPYDDFTIMSCNKDYCILKENSSKTYTSVYNNNKVTMFKPYIIKTDLLLQYLNREHALAYLDKPSIKDNPVLSCYADEKNIKYNISDENVCVEKAIPFIADYNKKLSTPSKKAAKAIEAYGETSILGVPFKDLFQK